MPATANQRRYVLAELAGAGSYMISMGHVVDGPLDGLRLSAAMSALVARHEALRTEFQLVDGMVRTRIRQEPRFAFHLLRAESEDFEAFRSRALPLIFDGVDVADSGSLVRLVAAAWQGRWRFTMAIHHACSDGFSRGVANRELLKLYAGEVLPEIRAYREFASMPTVASTSSEAIAELVARLPPPERLPPDSRRADAEDGRGLFVERAVALAPAALRAAVKACEATKFGVLGAVYGLGLSAFSGARDVSTFFQSEGRKAVGAPLSTIGPFSNTLPLDLSRPSDGRFAAYAAAVSEASRRALAFETSPLLDAVTSAGKGPAVSLNLFPPFAKIRAGDLEVGPREFLDRRIEFDLNLVWTEDEGVLRARAFYDGARLSEGRIERFLDLQERLLQAVVADPAAEAEILLDRARAEGRAVAPPSARPAPGPGRLHDAFFRRADLAPQSAALRSGGGLLTYRDLRRRALGYLGGFRAAGLGEGDVVAILAGRGPEVVATMFGASAAGCSFAVLDARYPTDRLGGMLARLMPRALVAADAAIPAAFIGLAPLVAPVLGDEIAPPLLGLAPRSAAYHLFTSGTTGLQKLVTHPEATLMRFLAWEVERLGGGAQDTLMLAGLSHDPVMRDVYLPFATGGAVAIPTPAEMEDPVALRALAAGATVLHLTPPTGRLLAAGLDGGAAFPRLGALFWGGDALTGATVRTWRRLAPAARQFNLYGATETPQAALILELDDADALGDRVSIGGPTPWNGARVVTATGATAAWGELGEIVVELADPVSGARAAEGEPPGGPVTTHRTGDFGFALDPHRFQIVGRRDSQVKINAQRIDLAEIADVARSVAGVADAVALVEPGPPPRLRLFAAAAPGVTDAAAIRDAVRRRLPAAAAPESVVVISRLPATPNGKIDTAALLALRDEVSAPRAGAEAPSTATEKAVAELFARYSGVRVGDRDTTFARLGADSLATVEARLALERLAADLPDDWDLLRLRDLASAIDRRSGARPMAGPALLRPSRLDSFIVLRAVAIAYVVGGHCGLPTLYGGSAMLFALAGYTFARLQAPAILGEDRTGRIWAALASIVIPLIPATILIYGVHLSIRAAPNPSALLGYENLSSFIDYILLRQPDTRPRIEWLWFLHAYIQIFVALALLFAIAPVRRWAARDPWAASVAGFAISVAVAVALVLGVGTWRGDVGHVAALLARSPPVLMPLFMLGGLAALADTPARRRLVFAFAAVEVGLTVLGPFQREVPLWFAAIAVVMTMRSLTLPNVVAVIATALSAHALMIYLSHRAAIFAFRMVLDLPLPPLAMTVTALAFGVAIGLAWQPVLRRLGVDRLAEMRVST